MVSLVKIQWCRSDFSYYTLYLLHKIQWCWTTPLFKVWLRHCIILHSVWLRRLNVQLNSFV
ncbi:hypothetical protein HanXRQr2_Chr10g0434101 [Helianthus annuus]|nr:hypothetical protein HanXRQr2_Chr10g0434101 [Helianthus annuus]KAJ0513367.1 hypothetical protein HanHA300_Chr10g0356811 [Helianthus annuus]KAJ0521189.1 hypothetical protein HanIR_Chr10g0468041 [Helianthus annuus]KAJ0529482.1 hypothetical protein HanHA89_Chr10g0378421 [Helianthus annuus]